MTAAVMASDGSYDPVISKLITSLKDAESLSDEQDLGFLQNLLQSKELNALVTVHSKVAKVNKDDRIAPLLSASMQVLVEVLEMLAPRCHISPLCREIFHLLQTPHLQSILLAHDAVAQKDFYPHLPEIPIEVDEDEETIKIVQLVKSNEPLCAGAQSAEPIVGATIKTDEETGKIIIARIMHGGAADRSGLIHVGDEVIEVNNINVEGKTPGDVLSILQNSEGTITFKLVPSDGKLDQRESKVRVKAYFDYEPENDPYIPCKEAGLGFIRGDILHIVSQDDSYWWQARKEGEKTTRAGLIPSRALQERRILHERSAKETNGETKTENDDFDREMIATYEEVAKLYPRPGVCRPIVLLGAPGIGRNELKRRLVARDPEKYKSPVPYTTRPMRSGEVAGREYLFVSREKMESDIANGKFIEYGEYKGHLYGTSGESVKSIVNAGCVCVLSPHYQALKSLRTAQLKPFIVHIRPPQFDQLKQTRTKARARSTFDETNSRGFTDEEFSEMIKSAERINFLYGHFCDDEILNGDLTDAFEKLVNLANKAETEPLWAPASWVQ
ncbi:MAGUK p55 subfamily member 7 isoform X3 [Toxorhynchites rutilus septentrionalis]|uniref:MAGUK p55 subfamily member 7 isoform X3 n=1 Tax=Toxorhynchites rutilus septentrionalis TaxID=329112 RepID=UPI00247AF47C|nr:MAGUK p55 subfamily member 7 isoform X3 [Toxorhynchites rutilus septentrionalis]